jgi:hypothetical protein
LRIKKLTEGWWPAQSSFFLSTIRASALLSPRSIDLPPGGGAPHPPRLPAPVSSPPPRTNHTSLALPTRHWRVQRGCRPLSRSSSRLCTVSPDELSICRPDSLSGSTAALRVRRGCRPCPARAPAFFTAAQVHKPSSAAPTSLCDDHLFLFRVLEPVFFYRRSGNQLDVLLAITNP